MLRDGGSHGPRWSPPGSAVVVVLVTPMHGSIDLPCPGRTHRSAVQLPVARHRLIARSLATTSRRRARAASYLSRVTSNGDRRRVGQVVASGRHVVLARWPLASIDRSSQACPRPVLIFAWISTYGYIVSGRTHVVDVKRERRIGGICCMYY